MARKMARWAQRLLDRHPGAERPSPDNPVPGWLEEELRRVPLWYHIREATDDPRTRPPFHLIEDVRRQPELLRGVLGMREALREAAEELLRTGVEHLVFTGCGSAYYNSVLGAFLFPRLTGLTAEAVESWEFYNYYEPTGRKTAVIAQSATGGSFEVLDAVEKAKGLGFPVLALTNTEGSALGELAGRSLVFPTGQKTGPDISVIPTRLLMMNLLAAEIARQTRPGSELLALADRQLPTIPGIVDRFLAEQEEPVQALAEKYHTQESILVVGGGPNWFTALEAGLKMEEESSTPCRAYQTADYPHMAISLLSPRRTTMVFAPPGRSYERLVTCVRTAREGGSPSIAVVLEGDREIARQADDTIVVPGDLHELFFPMLGTVVGQLYGYHLGLKKGFNPDCLGTDEIGHARAWLTSFPLGTH